MAGTAPATGALNLNYSGRLKPTKKATCSRKFVVYFCPNCTSTSIARLKGSSPVRALDPQREQEEDIENSSVSNDSGAATSQEDLEYVWKLVAGSIVGGAVIKYGSILVPEITRPNIVLALIMISTPVIIAVWLLIKQSQDESKS